MVTRACISINNRCNLNCTYCHFHEKKDYIQEDNMDVITILPAFHLTVWYFQNGTW